MKKVLLIDNDQQVLDMMGEALLYAGFDVKTILTADDIFPDIEEFKPDAVIIDCILTGINGGEICHQIKVDEKTGGLPVALVSAYPQLKKSLGDYGCDDFIPKPFDLEDFIGRVKKLTEGQMNEQIHAI